ncbi:Hypothetical predicted protein [Lynx pardinus]|uniref:Uncharacterized protein n=1 Tax=Lynx pardinus TaxID=191816 RepID=A0A485PID2_LYNPA|nr:Hypothetical predicted protein [Lynx pardinus]
MEEGRKRSLRVSRPAASQVQVNKRRVGTDGRQGDQLCPPPPLPRALVLSPEPSCYSKHLCLCPHAPAGTVLMK